MLDDVHRAPGSAMLVRFDQALADPIGFVQAAYRFLELSDQLPSHFYVKSKKTLKEDGSHSASVGPERQRLLIPADELVSVLEQGIDDVQIRQLPAAARAEFLSRAEPAMTRVGYL